MWLVIVIGMVCDGGVDLVCGDVVDWVEVWLVEL